jgi:thiol-disulfide isomerase/thioredoxin
MNKKHLAAYAVVALAFGASGAYVGMQTKEQAPPLSATQPPGVTGPVDELFKQSMPDAKGVATPMAQYKGKAMLVNFWAPWCGPCVQEMPELSALASGEEGKKLQVIGIGIDSPTNIAEFSNKYKISYPVLVAGMSGTELSRQFGNSGGGLPYTVLIGADGQVKKTYLGRLKFDELRKDLATL